MSLDRDILDLGEKKPSSIFGIISSAIAILWLASIILPRVLGGIFTSIRLTYTIILGIQFIGLVFAIIALLKKEQRRDLYLVGLIINGIGLLYFILVRIF